MNVGRLCSGRLVTVNLAGTGRNGQHIESALRS